MKRLFTCLNLFPLALVATLWLTPRTANAVKPYRCNGRVQFRHCEHDNDLEHTVQAAPGSEANAPVHDPRFLITGKRYATLLKSNYAPLSRTTGVWSGLVKGNGLIETELQIYRNGNLEARRYMGHVWLKNKETPFKITSSLPAGKGWDWKIAVWAR